MDRRAGRFIFAALLFSAAAVLPGQVRVVGSDFFPPTLGPKLEELAREAGLAVSVDFAGTRPGLALFATGGAEIALALLPPGEKPPADALVSRAIAYLPVVVVVPEGSPVRQLTLDQLRGVFVPAATAAVGTWGDLGVPGDWRVRPVAAHAVAPSGSLALGVARRLAFHGAELRPTVLLADDVGRLAERVRAGDNTIGLTHRLPAPDDGLRAVALAAAPTEPAYGPTAANLHDGTYALRLPLYLVFRSASAPRLLPVLRAFLGADAAAAFEAAGFIPLPTGPRNQLVFDLEGLR